MDEDMKTLGKATTWDGVLTAPNVIEYETADGVKFPVYSLNGFEDLSQIRIHGKTLAEKGVAANLHSSVINQAREMFGQQAVRNALKPMTAHNDKLGVNWRFDRGDSKPGYKLDVDSKHYPSSYQAFVATAALLWAETNYGRHLANLAGTFNQLQIPANNAIIPDRNLLNSFKPKTRLIGTTKTEYEERREDNAMVGHRQMLEIADIRQQLQHREDEIKELQEMIEMDKDHIKVDPRHVKGAFMDLPRMLKKAAEQGTLSWEQKYLKAMMDPFSSKCEGVRVPNLMDDSTVTTFDLQTFQFTAPANGRSLLVINYDAIRTGPYCFVNGPVNDFDNQLNQNLTVKIPGESDETINTVAYNSGLTSAQWQSASKYGKALENRNIYNSLRVVAGGFRIYETTQRENRGGIVRAAYGHRGLSVKSSMKKAVEDSVPHKNAAKVYLSGNSGCCRGRQGYVLGGTYRPKDNMEVSTFADSQAMFADEQGAIEFQEYEAAQAELASHWAANDIADTYHGPVVLFASANQGADPTNMVVTHDTFPGQADSEISISARSLQRQHTVVVMFEQVEPGTSFEVEIIRRLEGTASEHGQAFEEQIATLSQSYSTPFELLRRHDHQPIISPLQDELLGMHGLFDWPLIQTLKDMLGFKMTDNDTNDDTLGDWMLKAAPAVTRLVLSSIPGLNAIAAPVAEAVDFAVTGVKGMKGHQIPMIRQDGEEESKLGESISYMKGTNHIKTRGDYLKHRVEMIQAILKHNRLLPMSDNLIREALKQFGGDVLKSSGALLFSGIAAIATMVTALDCSDGTLGTEAAEGEDDELDG